LFLAQFIVQSGAAIQVAAVDWHIWRLTHDKLALGLVGLVRIGPIILLSLLGGVVSDAVDRRRLLMITESLTLLMVGILALSVLSGYESPALIYMATATVAGLSAFGSPARVAILPSLVPENRIADAARLSVVLFTVTSVMGPLVAGLILSAAEVAGPGIAYLAAALAFAPSLLILLTLNVPPLPAGEKREISIAAMKEGLNHIFSRPVLWSSMITDFVATFFSSALALLPVYADQILIHDTAGILARPEVRYGLLRAAPFFGAALGAVLMAQIGGRIKRQGEVMLWAVAVYGVATIIFGASSSFPLSLAALATLGFSDSVSAAIRNAMRQLLTPSRLRGRMQSVMSLFFLGGPQLGEFEAGAVAALANSAPFSVISGGVLTVAAVVAIAAAIPALRNYRETVPESEVRPSAIIAGREELAKEIEGSSGT
jgi:MFS family permease